MGYTVDENGLRINRQGTTDYWGVTRNSTTGEYWALASIAEDEYEITGSRTVLFELGVFYKAEDAAAAVRDFHADRETNLYDLKEFGRATKIGEGWAYGIPVNKEGHTYGPQRSVRKVRSYKTLDADTVTRQVNTLLGPNVKIQTRVMVKDTVVANLEFYRTASDVTAYVNDLMNYVVR